MTSDLELLRQRAEAELRLASRPLPVPADAAELVRELELHRIELEMQNEQLRSAIQRLEASQARYRELFEHAPVGYVMHGRDGISDANRAFVALLGETKPRVLGRNLAAFVMPGDVGALRDHERAVFASDGPESVELWLVATGGRHLIVRLESSCVARSGGTLRTAVIDVTAQRELERAAAGDPGRLDRTRKSSDPESGVHRSSEVVLPDASAAASTVLIVEDDPLFRNAVSRDLQRAHYRVLSAETAEQALAMLRAEPGVQLLLTDFDLPGMSGSELVDCTQAAWPSIRTLMMSGADRRRIVVPEGTRFLAKPFGGSELREIVRAVLDDDSSSPPHSGGR